MSYNQDSKFEKKYNVTKADGSPVDPEADYFVLNLKDDPAAWSAMFAFAMAVQNTSPDLSRSVILRVIGHMEDILTEFKQSIDNSPTKC